MNFSDIIGHDEIKQCLARLVQSGRLSNSLLFAGRDGIGKGLVAQALAVDILTQSDPEGSHRHKLQGGHHPDLYIFRPEGKIGMHSLDSMRRFSQEVYTSPSDAARKVFILHDADRMLPSSANALLKTFEEPAEYAVIILVSSQPQALLPTVLSRCQTLRFQPIAEEAMVEWLIQKKGCQESDARRVASLAQGSLGRAVNLLEQGEEQTGRQPLLVLLAMGRCATYKALGDALAPLCERLEAAKELLLAQLSESMATIPSKEMTAVQREALEKEVNGAVELRWREEVYALLTDILCWYRDLHLLQVSGDKRQLFHRDSASQLEQALQRGQPHSLEKVEKALAAARLAVERTTPLRTTLEALFLKLDYL